MKIVTRMLTVASIILWLVILFFSVTAVYSVMNVGINIGEAQMLPSSTGINLSLPFSIDNGGYYEIADLNLTTRVTGHDGVVLDLTETFVDSIPQGTSVNASHTIKVDLEDILTLDYLPLMLNDTDFNVEIFAGLNFAGAIPVQLQTNVTLPWGAPFAGFSVGEVSVSLHNSTHIEVAVPVTFENHAIIDIAGTLKIEVYNDSEERIASGRVALDVVRGQGFADDICIYSRYQDLVKVTGSGKLRLLFETPMFTVEWEEPYG